MKPIIRKIATIYNNPKVISILILLFASLASLEAQKPVLALSQSGYKPESPKTLTLIPTSSEILPDSIPFFLHQATQNRLRAFKKDSILAIIAPDKYFPPYVWNYTDYKFAPYDKSECSGWLVKKNSRWGDVWQADFSDFQDEGLWQIETETSFSLPFEIAERPYIKFMRGYMEYIYCQRSGMEIPGVRNAEHMDDGALDTDGSYHKAAGGWYNAGDLRKWMSLTQLNMQALYHIYLYGPEQYMPAVIDEIKWGNLYFHQMISEEGQVYEDIGGGNMKKGRDYNLDWWFENHPGLGTDGAGHYYSDNKPGTGDERMIRTSFNPFVQFLFIRNQALVSNILPELDASNSLYLAEKAWKYAREHGHDQRTIFVAEELDAAIELKNAGSQLISQELIDELVQKVLDRQDNGTEGLSHYFLEKDDADAYRSVAYSSLPATALLRAYELNLVQDELKKQVEASIRGYIDNYLLADAKSNPYELTPYGAFIKKPYEEYQTFRDAGRGRGVRTFFHVYNEYMMTHGTNGVIMSQAYLLAKAGYIFDNKQWKEHSEKLLQWASGHNPEGLSLFYGIGVRSAVPFSGFNMNMMCAALNGYIGYPDDTPYLETSNAMMWNTQEIWDIPFIYAVGATSFLELEK